MTGCKEAAVYKMRRLLRFYSKHFLGDEGLYFEFFQNIFYYFNIIRNDLCLQIMFYHQVQRVQFFFQTVFLWEMPTIIFFLVNICGKR